LRKGKWRGKGNRESNRLWLLFFNIFNMFFSANPSKDDAVLVLGRMLLARGAANIADQFSGWHPSGGAAALGGYALAGRQPAPPLSPSVTRLGLWQCGFAQRHHKPLKPPGEGEGCAIISFINR
jgi:hypothetical protein